MYIMKYIVLICEDKLLSGTIRSEIFFCLLLPKTFSIAFF